MNYYAGIDVSLKCSSVAVVNGNGEIVREAKVETDPTSVIEWLRSCGLPMERIGLEAGPFSQWLYAAMKEAGLAVELLETRHVRNAFKTMSVKTDRKDARGIAELVRVGWYRPVHCKSMDAQETRTMLAARKLVDQKLKDVEMSLRGLLRGSGLKVGRTTPTRFADRIKELVSGNATLQIIAESLLAVHQVLLREFKSFEKRVRIMARDSAEARLLMTRPGSGRSSRSPLLPASTIPDGSRSRRRSGRISGWHRGSISPGRRISPAGYPRPATPGCARRSTRPRTSC